MIITGQADDANDLRPGGLGNGSLGATGVQPLAPARRNRYYVGLEQQFGPRFNIQAEYFWKYTHAAYDFNTILNTPLNFPIQFRESKSTVRWFARLSTIFTD